MFTGIILRTTTKTPTDYADANTLIKALTPYEQADQTGTWHDSQAIIAHALTYNTTTSQQETTPWQCPLSKLVIASWIRLDNRQALAKQLNIDPLAQYTDPMLVVAAYRHWGTTCTDHLEGDYSFIIYDPQQRRCFAARDSLGAKPFYYYIDDHVFICSTTAAVYPRLRNIRLKPNMAWVARYLVNQSMSFTETGFTDVNKLAPAHQLDITPSTQQNSRYFAFQDNAPMRFKRDPRWVKEYREQLDQAVCDRLQSAYLIGSETSGGIDSSSVTALAAMHLPHAKNQFHVFGYAQLEQEPNYILTTSQRHGIPHNHIYTSLCPEETLETLLERELRVLGYPAEHNNASSHTMFYKQCQQYGIRTLLSGFGGDEVVTNPGHLLALELMDAGRYDLLYLNTPGNPLARVLRILKRRVESYQRKRGQYQSHIEQAARSRLSYSLLDAQADQDYQVTEHCLRSSRFDAEHRTINAFILADRLPPFIPTRMDNCSLIANSYKIEYRWPLLDRRLMQQYLDTPSIEKYSAKAGRYLHRQAVTDIVPHKICWKPSKYMGKMIIPYTMDTGQEARKTLEAYCTDTVLHDNLMPLVNQQQLQKATAYLKIPRAHDIQPKQWIAIRQCFALQKLNQWLHTFC